MKRQKRQKGSAMVEFVFAGTTLIFTLISVVQMAIGMWNYHTLQYALKQTASYVSVHGSSSGYCASYNCRIEDAATILSRYAIGIPQSAINLTFTPVTS